MNSTDFAAGWILFTCKVSVTFCLTHLERVPWYLELYKAGIGKERKKRTNEKYSLQQLGPEFAHKELGD